MELQWMGAIMIITGCGGIGFLMAMYDKREMTHLQQLALAVEYMICELNYRGIPLPELCRGASKRCKGGIADLFDHLARELDNQIEPDALCCMRHAMEQCPEFRGSVPEMLMDLGTTLGIFDLQGQLRSLEALLEQSRHRVAEMGKNRSQRLRGYQTLGLCAGAALAILLL